MKCSLTCLSYLILLIKLTLDGRIVQISTNTNKGNVYNSYNRPPIFQKMAHFREKGVIAQISVNLKFLSI